MYVSRCLPVGLDVCVRRKMKFEMIIASCLLRYEDGRCRINGNNNCIYAQLISEQCRNESVDLSTTPLPQIHIYTRSRNSHSNTQLIVTDTHTIEKAHGPL